jgi:hypothetical protein
MKNKEKKIEEMAKDISIAWQNANKQSCISKSIPLCELIAEELAKKYQPKLPEDSIVIPDKITEETSAEDLIKIAKYNDKIRKIERKETVEKIINWIDTYYPCYSRADLIKELAKQFEVGIKE